MAWVLGVATRTELVLSIALDFLREGERDINNKQVAAQEIVLKTRSTVSGGMSISFYGVGFLGGRGCPTIILLSFCRKSLPFNWSVNETNSVLSLFPCLFFWADRRHVSLSETFGVVLIYIFSFSHFSQEMSEATKLIGPKADMESSVAHVLLVHFLVQLLSSGGFIFTMAAWLKITGGF